MPARPLERLESRQLRLERLDDLVDRPDLEIVAVEADVEGCPRGGVLQGVGVGLGLVSRVDVTVEVDVGRGHRAVVLAVPGEHRVVVERELHVAVDDLGLVVGGGEQVGDPPVVVIAPDEMDRAAADLVAEPAGVPHDGGTDPADPVAQAPEHVVGPDPGIDVRRQPAVHPIDRLLAHAQRSQVAPRGLERKEP